MAKIELPILAFIQDYAKQAFPERDWSPGSAVRDLVIYPMASMLQPLRHEIDAIKVNQSITNYPYMRREDLDGLAANWAKFRQQGGRAVGNVRLYFDRAADYQLNFLRFFDSGNNFFILQSPVRITARELIANRLPDNTFYFDVPVQSIGIGNRFALSAGSIVGVENSPPSLVRVENVEDFEVTAPDESNFDVVNSMFRDLGLRNLVSRSSIRAPILENFPGVLDIFVAGADHPSMIRDVETVENNGSDVELHLGGMTDVWVNTNGVVQRSLTLGYLPSSKTIKIVSAEQAGENTLLYGFARLLLDTEGRYASFEYSDTDLDESVGIFIDQAGLPVESYVIDTRTVDRYQLSETDIVSGDSMVSLPVPGNELATVHSYLLTDLVDINFANTDVTAGHILRVGNEYRRIVEVSGRVLKVASEIIIPENMTYDISDGVTAAGDRFIPLPNADAVVQVNDRAVITRGDAQGHYRVLAVDATGIWVGNPVSAFELTYVSDDGGEVTYEVGGTPEIPIRTNEEYWVTFIADGGYDQTPASWNAVVSVLRSEVDLQLVTSGGPVGGPHSVHLVKGLNGPIDDQTTIYFERESADGFDRDFVQAFNVGHTIYTNVLPAALPVASNTLEVAGIGSVCQVGDIILFDSPGTLAVEQISQTGGDGTKYSVLVEEVIDSDTVVFAPSLPAELPENLKFSVIRNQEEITTLTADNVAGSQVTFNSWPIGLGDGLGMAVRATQAIVTEDIGEWEKLADDIARITFNDTPDLSEVRAGDTLTVTLSPAAAYDGVYTVLSVDDALDQVIVEGATGTAADTFVADATVADIDGSRIAIITASTAGDTRTLKFEPPRTAIDVTFQAAGYVAASPGDIGAPVRQEEGGNTHAGVLDSYDNATRTWTIVPNDPATDVFATSVTPGEEIVVVNGAAEGLPNNISATYDIGYYEPVVGDLGLLVRQGTYVGTLDSYVGTPTYEWLVKPLSEFDLFDQTNVVTFVDRNGTGTPVPDEAQGTLRVPATEPEINSGSVVVTLDRNAPFVTSDSVDILSRIGRSGGFIDGKRFRVYDNSAINTAPFAGVDKDLHKLVILAGGNFDVYDIAGVSDFELEIDSGAPLGDPVRIANAPGPQSLSIAASIPAGSLSISSPGSKIGLFGHAGRILKLTYAGVTVNLTISGPNGIDGVNLLDPIPAALFPSQAIEFEVLEGYHLPFMIVPEANLESYRIFDAPEVGDVLLTSTTGQHSTLPGVDDRFTDQTVSFTSLVGYHDFNMANQELLLFIDDGPEASVTPYKVIGLDGDTSLILDHTFTESDENVSYHLVLKNTMAEDEEWFEATITGNNSLTLDAPASFVPSRFGGHLEWQVVVRPLPGLVGTITQDLDIPNLSVTDYTPATRELLVDVSLDHVAETTIAGIFDTDAGAGTRGFLDDAIQRKVRVMFRATNRASTLTSAGSAVNTFNYYSEDFFTLPIVRIQSVVQLDPDTLQPTLDLPFSFVVNDAGLRYSHKEDNEIQITEPGNDVVFQPIRITYLSDPTIENIDNYLNDPDNRVVNGNPLAKRMETISISVSVEVRSEQSVGALQSLVASYINNLDSTQRMSKDGLIKFLYEQSAVSFIDTDSMVLSGTFYKHTGEEIAYSDVSEIFGSDTAAYLSNVIVVTKVSELES